MSKVFTLIICLPTFTIYEITIVISVSPFTVVILEFTNHHSSIITHKIHYSRSESYNLIGVNISVSISKIFVIIFFYKTNIWKATIFINISTSSIFCPNKIAIFFCWRFHCCFFNRTFFVSRFYIFC